MSSKSTIIIWTRSAEHWESDMRLFSGEHNLVSFPCIKHKSLPEAKKNWQNQAQKIDRDLSVGFLFTSVNAVTNSKNLESMWSWVCDNPCFAFGRKTKKHLENLGVDQIFLHKSKNAEEWLVHLVDNKKIYPKQLIWPGPKIRAFDLSSALEKNGYRVFPVDVYETIKPQNPVFLDSIESLFSNQAIVCFASPSAAKFFNDIYPEKAWIDRVAVIGSTTALACHALGYRNIVISESNSLLSLASLAESFG